MAIGGVAVPGRSDFLPLTGGTVTGQLTVTGGITGDLTGNVTGDVEGSASKWNGKTLRLEHNTSAARIPVVAGNYVDYLTKDELLQGLASRVSTLEAKYNAIAKTTEVLLKSTAYNVTSASLKSGTVTLCTAGSDVEFVKFGTGSSADKLLRGSSMSKSLSVYFDGGVDNSYWTTTPGTVKFNTNGTITLTDTEGTLKKSYYTDLNEKGTVYQYKYVVSS